MHVSYVSEVRESATRNALAGCASRSRISATSSSRAYSADLGPMLPLAIPMAVVLSPSCFASRSVCNMPSSGPTAGRVKSTPFSGWEMKAIHHSSTSGSMMRPLIMKCPST